MRADSPTVLVGWLLLASCGTTKMNPADFQGLYWYKLFIPCFTWGSIIGTFLGPLLFPTVWFIFVGLFMIVFVLVSLSQVNFRRLENVLNMPCIHALDSND
jgi:hypothetical protein